MYILLNVEHTNSSDFPAYVKLQFCIKHCIYPLKKKSSEWQTKAVISIIYFIVYRLIIRVKCSYPGGIRMLSTNSLTFTCISIYIECVRLFIYWHEIEFHPSNVVLLDYFNNPSHVYNVQHNQTSFICTHNFSHHHYYRIQNTKQWQICIACGIDNQQKQSIG